MHPSHAFDPGLHPPGSSAAEGRCSYHGAGAARCLGEAVVSYEAADGTWHSGCSSALEELVESGEIEPLGQGA